MLLDAAISVLGMVIPPTFDFIKKKFLKNGQDSANATLNTLATTKPEIMPQFIEAQSALLEAQTKFFNRDIVGNVHSWVSDLRAIIRPLFVLVSACVIFADIFINVQIDPSLKQFMEFIVGNWFGSRLNQ